MSVLKKAIRGIRDTWPSGYILGRKSQGAGPPELISFADIAQQLVTTPQAQAAGGFLRLGLAANRPANPNVPPGQTAFWFSTDTQALSVWTGSAWTTVGGGGGGLFGSIMSSPVPSQAGAGFTTWVNQSTATATDGKQGIIITQGTAQGSNNIINGKTKAVPATPYTATALIFPPDNQTATCGAIFGWQDSVSGKLHTILTVPQTFQDMRIYIATWNSPTSNASATTVAEWPLGMPFFIQLKDDGTNVSIKVSRNGDDFNDTAPLAAIAKSSAFLGSSGYNHIIFGVDAFAAACQSTLASYKETSP